MTGFSLDFFICGTSHAQIQEFLSGSVQVRLPENSPDFFCFFLVLNLFYSLQRGSSGLSVVLFQRNLYFSKIPVGGPTFSRVGGPNADFYRKLETHITCDFPGGSGPPCPPSGSARPSRSPRFRI